MSRFLAQCVQCWSWWWASLLIATKVGVMEFWRSEVGCWILNDDSSEKTLLVDNSFRKWSKVGTMCDTGWSIAIVIELTNLVYIGSHIIQIKRENELKSHYLSSQYIQDWSILWISVSSVQTSVKDTYGVISLFWNKRKRHTVTLHCWEFACCYSF